MTDNTKICGKHFPEGERVCRTQLPTIFPWSKPVKRRREFIKYELPSKSKKINDNSSTTLLTNQVALCTDKTNDDLDINRENKDDKGHIIDPIF